MKKIVFLFYGTLLTLVFSECGNNNSSLKAENAKKSNTEESETINTEAIKEVKIGDQVWMSFNLNTDKFRNGDLIPEAKTNEEWVEAGEKGLPVWCYYENNSTNGGQYGKLYNWFAVNDPRGLAPNDWHIPSDDEWISLVNILGQNEGLKLKSKDGWERNGNGTNDSGFSGLPGGYRKKDGEFKYLGAMGHWWSSTENDNEDGWQITLGFNTNRLMRGDFEKIHGMSVRCIKD
jgi:uncharacterized protein (TIGR02145 family)